MAKGHLESFWTACGTGGERARYTTSPTTELVMSSFFRTNVGTLDRVFRLLLGVGVLSMAFTGPQSAWGYLGIIPLLTGAFGTCPIYSALGLNTCAVKRA